MKRVSVRQLALRLDANRSLVRGVVIGLGIRLEMTPAADYLDERDASKVKAKIEAYRREVQAIAS